MAQQASLAKVPVSELVPDSKDVISFTPSLTVGDALEVLGHYEVFGAPVVGSSGGVVGSVDYLALLCFLVDVTAADLHPNILPPSRTMRSEDLDILLRHANDWSLTALVESGVIKVSMKRPFFYVQQGASLGQAVASLARGVHHLLVVDEDNKVVNILSQTDVVQWCAANLEQLGELPNKTLGQLKLGTRSVFCVRNSDTAIDAFYEMHRQRVSGAGIINGEGRLVGNLSASDLRGTEGEGFSTLTQSVMVYQRKHRGALSERLVTVSESTTFAEVVALMNREKVHRVFLVQSGMFPSGIITQTDICAALDAEFTPDDQKLGKKKLKAAMKQAARTKLQFPVQFPPQ